MIEYKNKVKLQGPVVNKYETDKVTILSLSVGNESVHPNFPKVVFFKTSGVDLKPYGENDLLTVSGYVQSSVRDDGAGKKTVQSIIGETADPVPGTDETPGKARPATANCAIFTGEVVIIDGSHERVTTVTLRIYKGTRKSEVKLDCYDRKLQEKVRNLHVHDFVYAIANVQTVRKIRESGPVYYENMVINYIDVLDDVGE